MVYHDNIMPGTYTKRGLDIQPLPKKKCSELHY